MSMHNIMIDIETLGRKSDAMILSISAVAFDPLTGSSLDFFHNIVDVEDAEQYGLKCDAPTVTWWLKQSKEAQEQITKGTQHKLIPALLNLNEYIKRFNGPIHTTIWAKSPEFDLSILKSAMDACGVIPAWKYWQQRDVRTIAGIIPEAEKMVSKMFVGVKHYGVDDCLEQIALVSHVYQKIKIDDDKR